MNSLPLVIFTLLSMFDIIISHFKKIEKSNLFFYGGMFIILFFLLFFLALYGNYTLVSSYFGLNKSAIDKDIIIVALDDETLNSGKFKKYQDINRCDYTTLLSNILSGKPKAVVIDTVLYQTAKSETCARGFMDILAKNPNVIVGVEYTKNTHKLYTDLLEDVNYNGSIGITNTLSYTSLNVFNWKLADYHNRVRIYDKGVNSLLPLSIETYQLTHHLNKPTLTSTAIIFNSGTQIPIDEGYVNINYFTNTYPTTSFVDVIDNPSRSNMFSGKVVFVGVTAPNINDQFLTPYDTSHPISGVMIHANLYNTLTAQKFIDYESIGQFLFINAFLIFLCIIILVQMSNFIYGVLYSLGIIVAYVLVSLGIFQYFGMMLEIFPLLVCYGIISIVVYFKKFIHERKSKDQVREIFSRYISEDVAHELIELGIDNIKLGGTEREVTVFFSDLAGFTDLSEALTPEELGRVLNIYLEEMSSIILREKGTIDKFIGDAIMAFWNAPMDLLGHANTACVAALLQREALEKVRTEVKALGCETFIDMRIGIHTGKAIIGNFGCSKRHDYTALGDTVNLASRLESINKQYGTNIIISEETYSQVEKDQFIIRELDFITVKGKTKPLKIYELIGFNNLSENEKLQLYREALQGFKDKKYNESMEKFKKIWDIPSQQFIKKLKKLRDLELYEKALILYRAQQFIEARDLFERIGDTPSRKFIERCDEFIQNPPPCDWDQVHRFKVK